MESASEGRQSRNRRNLITCYCMAGVLKQIGEPRRSMQVRFGARLALVWAHVLWRWQNHASPMSFTYEKELWGRSGVNEGDKPWSFAWWSRFGQCAILACPVWIAHKRVLDCWSRRLSLTARCMGQKSIIEHNPVKKAEFLAQFQTFFSSAKSIMG